MAMTIVDATGGYAICIRCCLLFDVKMDGEQKVYREHGWRKWPPNEYKEPCNHWK